MNQPVESFAFDHRTLTAPFVRLAGSGLGGLDISKYDLRLITPNKGAMDTDGLHSLEHLLAGEIRLQRAGVIDISPMGCRTGFYLCEVGQPDLEGVTESFRNALVEILNATEVPAANETQCGNAQDHNLEKAKVYARLFLGSGQ
jgi:S-ribosylhomocysteine lyase